MQVMIILKLLLKELGFCTTQANVIHEDNQSCIKICYTPKCLGDRSTSMFDIALCRKKLIDTSSPSLTAIPKLWLLVYLLTL
ncbi:hypothetical protein PF010_g15198 [Phytophthora fragariae]|uniref:Reverse transcriptase Ty1/copia-type domain-containing protein n=1 Tax=Phytophthora fragariae TaxID=53985 RepID=A0A6A3K4V5_9STRA|nr:hypothetical protein PF011_g14501 [Phytophthora fragariae]KAE9099420.1 hypothetical protein PF010_g15198 [Phytophthora fragariae]KAE9216031.1 hypothetical protein PF004_g14566 [Phytophthora fragariae]